MKTKTIAWAADYRSALRKHLRPGPGGGGGRVTKALGHQAAVRGLERLEVVRIHREALGDCTLPRGRGGRQRAARFLAAVLAPIEQSQRALRSATAQLRGLNRQLIRRTADLALSNQHLVRGIRRRKGAESALKKSAEHHARLLKKSRQLQQHLRQLTRRILVAREDRRAAISRQLQDEIAQTLLGIRLRLLVLQRDARAKSKGFQNEIATTQRLVGKSIGEMKRFDCAHGGQHEA